MGGLSRRFVKINEMRENGIDPLIVDAGDLFFSTKRLTVSNKKSEIFRAGAILEGYGKIGCDAINVGHYEMLNGLSFLKEMEDKTDIPFLSANLRDATSNSLLFEPFRIVEKGSLKIGIIGVTDKLPDTSRTIIADDYILAGNEYINQLSKQTDIIVMLVNADQSTYSDLPTHFENADFIVTSGSTNLTRNNNQQKKNGPYLYSCGKQGKFLSVLTVSMNDSDEAVVDVSSHETKIKSIHKRFERLQKKDVNKSLEDIYANQENVLKLIRQYREDLIISESAIAEAVNTIKYETISLNKKIKDNPELLSFVNKSLATCNSLSPKIKAPSKSVKTPSIKMNKRIK